MIIADIIIIINPPSSHRDVCKLITRHASSPNINLWKRDRNALSRRRSSGESISFYYYDRELTRCNGERRQRWLTWPMWHIYIHIFVHTYVHMCVYIYIYIYMYVYTRTCVTWLRAREEVSRRAAATITACNRLSFLLHYSSPKWMMQIMFRTNSRIYTHARENLYAFTLTHMDCSFFLALAAEQRFPILFNSPFLSRNICDNEKNSALKAGWY